MVTVVNELDKRNESNQESQDKTHNTQFKIQNWIKTHHSRPNRSDCPNGSGVERVMSGVHYALKLTVRAPVPFGNTLTFSPVALAQFAVVGREIRFAPEIRETRAVT